MRDNKHSAKGHNLYPGLPALPEVLPAIAAIKFLLEWLHQDPRIH